MIWAYCPQCQSNYHLTLIAGWWTCLKCRLRIAVFTDPSPRAREDDS